MKFIFLLLLNVFIYADSVMIQESIFDYENKFKSEHDTKLSGEFGIHDNTLIVSIEDINKYGLNGQQFGSEFYFKFNEKDWGYVSAYIGNNSDFLPIYDISSSLYKSFYQYEIGIGLKRMSYKTKNINIVKTMFHMPIFKSTTLMETLSYVPENNTKTLNSKVVFNNEKDLKVFYSFTFGNGAEEIGFYGLKKIEQKLHQIGIEYKLQNNFSIGGELVKEFYKDLYIRTGGNINLKYNW